MTKFKLIALFIFFVFFILNAAVDLRAEFYKYVDNEGQTHYVDDLSRVPPEYLEQIEVYREKYDHLPEEQKKSKIESEQQQQQAIEFEKQRRIELELQQAAESEAAERERQKELDRQKKQETPVVIKSNRVFVPTTIGNNGVEVEILMLLDTGASQTVVHREIADQLNIIALRKGFSQVAGGQQIYTEMGKVDFIKVGPHKINGAGILIINHEGAAVTHNGLLGMNILRNFNYDIDFENQMIVWQPAN